MSQTVQDNSTFFANRACEYFPCHEGIDPDAFNCLFCYCPLYALGTHCNGNWSYTASGIKSCENCTVMHEGTQGVERVAERFNDLAKLASKDDPAV